MSESKKRLTPTLEFNNLFDNWLADRENKISAVACNVMRFLISKANNKTAIAFPTIKTIIQCTRLSKSSVDRAFNELEKLLLMKRHKRESANEAGFKRNEYRILLSKDFEDPPN